MVYTWDIPGIYRLSEYTWYIHVYTDYIPRRGSRWRNTEFQPGIANFAPSAAAPGKMYIAYDIVCIHRMHISPVSGDMHLRHRNIPTTSYDTDVTHACRIRHCRKPTI